MTTTAPDPNDPFEKGRRPSTETPSDGDSPQNHGYAPPVTPGGYGTPPPPPGANPYAPSGNGYGHPSQAQGDVPFETQKLAAILAHIGGVFFSWLVPLIVYLVYPANRAPWLNRHAKEALNFQITLFIGYVISGILMFVLIGYLTWIALWIYSVVAAIMASIAANKGEDYRYPLSIRLIS